MRVIIKVGTFQQVVTKFKASVMNSQPKLQNRKVEKKLRGIEH